MRFWKQAFHILQVYPYPFKNLLCEVCDDVNMPRLERIGSFHLRHNCYGVRTNAFQSYFMVTIIPFPVKPVGMCLIIMLKQIKVNTFITH